MPLNNDDVQGGRTPATAKPAPKAAAKPVVAAPVAPWAAKPAWAAPNPGQAPAQPAKAKPAKPTAPILEPPDPTLQAHGFNGGIQQFNQRVANVVQHYRTAYGTPAPPNLVFDLALSSVPDHKFAEMFTVPVHPQAAQARGVLARAGHTPATTTGPDPVLSLRDLTVGMVNAAARGGYNDFLTQHADAIHDLQKNPATASRVNGAIQQAKLVDEHRKQVGEGSNQPGMPADYGNPNNLVAPADRAVYAAAAGEGFVQVGKFAAKAVGQVADSLVHAPAGLAQVAKAAGLDASDATAYAFSRIPGSSEYDQQHGSLAFSRTRTIAKATAKGTLQDVEHPADNPGYLFLDALGLASAGAGTAARIGAAGRAAGELGEAASAGAKAAAAAKALARKPELQRATVNYRGYTEQMPLSQNALVAAAQKGILKVREKGAVQGRGPLQSFLLPGFLQDALEEQLSIPKKLGRLADTRKRVEFKAQTTLQRELDAVAGRKVFQSRVLSRTPEKIRGGLSRGEQKAIQVMATDDLNPLTTEREFHQSMIDQGIGDVKAHRRQLADLKLAEKALADPSPRLLKALDLTRRVVAEQERIKIQDLGLLPETAEGRVAKLGAFYRGENFADTTLVDNPEYKALAASGETLLHGTNATFDRFGGGEAKNRYGRAVPLAQRRSYFTDKPEVADRMAHSGAYKQVDAYKFADVTYGADLDLPRLRQALDAQVAKGRKLYYTDENGRLVEAKSAADVPDSEFLDQSDVRIYNKAPRVIKATVYGKTLDLTDPKDIPADLSAALKKEGRFDPAERGAWAHEHSKVLIDYAEQHGYGKIVVRDGEESGFKSTIALHDYIEHGGKKAPIFDRVPEKLNVPAKRVNEDSFYLPVQPRGKIKRPPSSRSGYYPTKAGPFGIPVGRTLPELSHEFTGKAITAGDYRIDATSLASEGYGRTVRAATVRAEHARLWQGASDTPQTRFDIPIRDANKIPDQLRKVIARIDEGDFTQADAGLLPADMADLVKELYPHPDRLTDQPIDGVKWVDSRLLGEGNLPPQVEGGQARIGDLINEPFRFLSLYVRPAYILNKLGNQAMLTFDQGVFSSAQSILRAMNGERLYGDENMRTIRELTGSGHAHSLVTSKSSKVGQAVAEFWNRVADRDERSASFIYYANRLGYTTKDDFTRLLNAKEARPDLVEATTRANNALVGFDNLLPFEKNVLRHWVFVYPWVSRSAVWSIRAILEHPIKTDLLAQLGKEDIQDDPLNGNVVSWVRRAGYVPLGWDHSGNPKVVSAASVNTFSTIGDFIALTRAATEGDKYASAEDFLGPFPKYMVHAITGRDEFGNQYPGSQWWDAAKEVMQGLPQVSAYQRAGNDKTAGKIANVGSRSSIVASFNAAMKRTVLTPGWLDGYGTLLVGGLSPRSVNMDAAAARYWNDQDPQVRHSRELDLLNRALNVQGEVLKTPVPTAVRSAVKDQANITFAAQQFQKAHGRAPTDKERATLTLSYLVKQGVIPAAQQAKLAKNLAGLVDPHDIALFKNALVTKYGYGKQLRQWDTDIRTVASFNPQVFNAKVEKLYQQGLAPQRRYQVSQDSLYDYGRKYVAFTHQVTKLQQDIKDGTKTDADLRAFQDAHDVPVDGLPSFVRVAWTNNSPQAQQQHIAAITTQSWGGLTVFDKQLLGVKSDAKVTAGWARLKDVVAEQRTKLEREGQSYPAGYTRILAKWVEKTYDAPGLVRDYDFSKEPLYRRMQVMKPIASSPNKDLWSKLFVVANDYHRYLNTDGYNKTQVRQMWRDYVAGAGMQQWIDENPSFKAEIGQYGKGFLARLIG